MKLFTILKKISFSIIFTFSILHFSFGQNATNGGEIGYDQTIYLGTQPDTLFSISSASGGDTSLNIEYIWSYGNSLNPSSWISAPGENDKPYYVPPPLNATTYFFRSARRQGFLQFIASSNVIIITAVPGNLTNGGIIGPDQIVMINEQPDTIFEIQPAYGGDISLAIEYQWFRYFHSTSEEPAEGINDQFFYVPSPQTSTARFRRKARREGFTEFDSSNIITILVETTSIEDIENDVIRIYPNPVTNDLQIEFKENNSSNWLVEIFDIKGSLQKTMKFENVQDNQTINLHNLAKGTYLIQLTDLEDDKVERFKFLKK